MAFLFDIDGTLLDVFHIHIDAYAKAIKRKFDVDVVIDELSETFGLPEADCYRGALRSHGIEPTIDDIEKLKQLRSEVMIEELKEGISQCILPGVIEALDIILESKGQIAFISGNNHLIGQALLRYSGLLKYSSVTAFGDEIDGPREQMIALAIKRGNLKRKFYVVGDSTHDVTAAKNAECEAWGIATYITSREDLARAGADHAFLDWKELKAHLGTVLSKP